MRFNALVLTTCSAAFLASGCEIVLGLDKREVWVDPLSAEDSGAQDSGPDVPLLPTGCSLDQLDAARTGLVRLANLVPNASKVDFCLIPKDPDAGAPPFPFIKSHGSECPALGYGQVLRPQSIEPGEYEVHVVPANAADCSAASSSVAQVQVNAGTTMTIARVGGANQIPEKVVALPEIKAKDGNIRFVHGVATSERLFFGATSQGQMPARFINNVSGVDGVEFGSVPLKSEGTVFGPINEAGYLNPLNVELPLGAARKGAENAILSDLIKGQEVSIFAVGIPESYEYPVRAVICQESDFDGFFTRCHQSALPQVTVDSVNAGLYGLFAPFEAERRPEVIKAVSELETDFVCVQESARDADREAMIAAAAAAGILKYSYNPEFGEGTPFTNPKDQAGNTPADLGAPCGEPEVLALSDAAMECIQTNCSTDPNDPNAKLKGGADCLSSKCLTSLIVMIGSKDIAQRRCVACLLVNLMSEETLAGAGDECSLNAKAGYAFQGKSPELLLSRFPLTGTETYVLNSTSYRRAVLHATAEVAEGVSVDVYCAQFSYIHGITFPYSGFYGAETNVDGTVVESWHSENYLQAQRTIEWVKSRQAPQGIAIIAGDFSSSEEVKENDVVKVDSLNPVTVQLLRKEFVEAVPPGWQPLCNFCATPENPYGGKPAYWLSHIFTYGRKVGIDSFTRTLTDDQAVDLPEEPFKGTVSDNFGIRSKIVYQLGW